MDRPTTQTFGESPAREGGPDDEVQNVRPSLVVSPATAEQVAAALREAAAARASIVIRGRGTKMDWGRPPGPIDVLLDLSSLDRVLKHEHGDMTATVEGGATLSGINAMLGRHGQWLPIDSSFPLATIGGTLASADSGPLRHRFGTTRDLIIGVTLATTDGQVVKAGGQVVKNVAGYDLGKLMSGSFGSLAAIVDATFKLTPRPTYSATLIARFSTESMAPLTEAVARLRASQLEPMCVDLHTRFTGLTTTQPDVVVQLRFVSTRTAVEAQLARARELMVGAALVDETEEAEAGRWQSTLTGIWHAGGAIARLSWRAAELGVLLTLLRTMSDTDTIELELCGRALVGAGLLRIGGDIDVQARTIERLRSIGFVGQVSLLRGSVDLKRRVDAWGDIGSSLPALQALKRAFDPAGVLNAGRGVV